MTHHADERVTGVVAVAECDGRLLMIQRSRHVVAPGAWCFPGGAVGPGETPQDAIAREMMEELGVEVRPVCQLWRWVREDSRLELLWWQVELRSNTPRPNRAEVQEWRWMTPAQIRATPDVLANNITFLDHLERLRSTGSG